MVARLAKKALNAGSESPWSASDWEAMSSAEVCMNRQVAGPMK